MKRVSKRKLLACILLSLVLFISACSGLKPSKSPQLPDGLASAMVPNMPLDGYFFMRQSQPTLLPGRLLKLPADITLQSVEGWIIPSDSTEILGAVVTFLSAQDAGKLFPFIPDQRDLWKHLADNKIFFVFGNSSGVEGLKNAITSRQFVPLSKAAPDGWDLIQRLPDAPASKPPIVGFVRLEDRLLSFIQNYAKGAFDDGTASAFKMAKIEIAAMAIYSNRVHQVTDLLSPANLVDGGVGGILVAKSSYPGFAISAALGPLASRLSLEKTDIDGKSVFYRVVDAPGGEKIHILFNNSGQYIYSEVSAKLERTKELHRWVWGN